MNKRGDSKKAQMQISFGVIFSIILIVIFIAFAIYAIGKFMGVQKFAQVKKFQNDFQGDIDKMWKSTRGSQEVEYFLPKKIKQICFLEDKRDPMTSKYFNAYYVPDDFDEFLLKNVDMTTSVTGSTTNPKTLCVNTTNGKISMAIKKGYSEDLVTITK
jgi:hypothetical protein